VIELPLESWAPAEGEQVPSLVPEGPVEIVERAHPDLGKLGVFWHTQGSGKSYSMAFFAEKVRRIVPGNFTFVLMTDRNDLDSQIYKTFVGCGIADDRTPRAGSGKELEKLLKENHRYLFSLIHKFSQDVNPKEPYSRRDDIIVISDEAHRTQSGRLARNMRLALPNAAFIGFTGTPLFKHDEITKRILGDYVSRYDFKRSKEDGALLGRLAFDDEILDWVRDALHESHADERREHKAAIKRLRAEYGRLQNRIRCLCRYARRHDRRRVLREDVRRVARRAGPLPAGRRAATERRPVLSRRRRAPFRTGPKRPTTVREAGCARETAASQFPGFELLLAGRGTDRRLAPTI
jgi:superfamily II DNA or RNA helicase